VTRRGPTLMAVIGLLALTACGVPADSSPRPIPAEDVPFDLLEPGETVPVTTTVPVAGTVPVFLLSGERLAGVDRSSPAAPTPEWALRALLAGPTPEEAARGLRTAIGTNLALAASGAGGNLVEIELGTSFTAAGGAEQILAIAQVVYTMTAFPEITGVTFTVDGKAVEVPRGDGTLTGAPLGRAAFPAVAPG
jgi:hypothetical protein